MTEEWKTEWEKMAEAGDLEGAVVEFVRKRDWVTFVEIQNLLGDYIETQGECSMEIPNMNIVYWAGMSDAFFDVVEGLLEKKRVFFHPSSWFTYMIDGSSISLPVAKSIPKGGYKKPRWLPVCFRVEPLSKPKRSQNG